MTIVASDENNRNEDKENEAVRMVTISDRNSTGPRIPDRGLVGRSGHQAAKRKMDPTTKSFSNRISYHFQFR